MPLAFPKTWKRVFVWMLSAAFFAGCSRGPLSLEKIGTMTFPISETSGITYVAASDTFFVASDRGDIAQIDKEGHVLRQNNINSANFEGITHCTATGMLYAVIEGKDRILEVDPASLRPLREFTVNRKMDGKKVVGGGEEGFEGITFVRDAKHPEGGTFYVVNQAKEGQEKPEPSAVLHVKIPLRTGTEADKKTMKGTILEVFPMPLHDLSAVHFDERTEQLYVLSDTGNQIILLDKNGKQKGRMQVNGYNMEGIEHNGNRDIVIVEDQPESGTMLIFAEP